jgi:hypothetical protein
VKRQKAVTRGHAREETVLEDKHMRKEYTGTIHLVTTENSIQLPTTTNINRRPSIRVPNNQKELGCMLGGYRVHILRKDF